MSLGAAACVALALGFTGCSAAYVEQSEASVMLQVLSLNDGAELDSDVRNGEFSTFVCEDEVEVSVRVENKNPTGPVAPSSNVQLESYEVRYTRSDGRGTEGVDVPYRITGSLSRTVAVNAEETFSLEVVRRQAKLDPPLTNISQTTVLTVSAHVTVFGRTVSEKRVSAAASMQIDFADFGDKDTACPGN